MRHSFAALALLAALAATAAGAPPAAAQVVESYAVVRPDATLLVRGRVYRLAGVYVPANGRQCRTYVNPRVCGNRAAVALDFKIQRFVRCEAVGVNRDGTIAAFCETNYTKFEPGEDLGAYLIERGLAVATPDAPFEYHALERIAAANNQGVWGFQVDAIGRRVRSR